MVHTAVFVFVDRFDRLKYQVTLGCGVLLISVFALWDNSDLHALLVEAMRLCVLGTGNA